MAPRGEDAEVSEGGAPPQPPTNLEVTDWDATVVKLKWKAPLEDGGSPITFYILEFKSKTDADWQAGPKVKPAKSLAGAVDGLTSGLKYEFRVVAENRAGKSRPSEPTLPLLVKAQKAAPRICRQTLQEDKAVKVNQQLDLTVPVEGEPAPECWWLKDGQDLSATDSLKCSSGPGNAAKLLFIPAKRCHQGRYTLKAKNKWGEDSADIEINVFGKPTIPTGPLVVSEVTKKSCRLQWKPSDDNGGSPILQYEVEKMDESMGSWLPVGNTKGLSLDVRNLVEGRNYKFLVRSVNKDGDSPDLETPDFITAKNAFNAPGKPGKPKPSNWGPNWAELVWAVPEDDGGAEISEYKVEMRDVDKRAWNEIGRCREAAFTAEKCGIEAGHEYVFRITAYNAGGESEASDSSSPIEAKERFVKPHLDKDNLGKEKELVAGQLLKLEALVTAEPPAKINWFLPNGDAILHDGDRIIIDASTPNISSLMFKNVERSHTGNFKILAKNSQGEDEHEIRITIKSPPSRPTGVLEASKVTPTGCHLTWAKPKDDGGVPIVGYTIEKKDVERDYWSKSGQLAGKMATIMKSLEFDVTDLKENFVYVFRVMAFNALGESEPLMSLIPVVAKHELDPPNQPYNITIVDYDKKWVKLEWTVPPGPKPTKYIIEKVETFLIPKDEPEEVEQELGGDEEGFIPKPSAPKPSGELVGARKEQEYVEYSTGWMHAGTTDDDMPEIKLTDLQEGYRYEFRVKAVNKAGASLPSESTPEIVAKQRKQKPVIDRYGMPKEFSLPRGENLVLKVKVQGEPITEKAWFWGKREIKPSGSVNIENSDYASKITVFCLERADTGTFSFRAENDHGSAEASIEVTVTVHPQRPKGPMRIDDIHAEGCTASWSAPDDDGGSPITHYIVEKVQGTGENWMPCGRVSATETTCKIVGLTPLKEYRLQVKAVNSMGESEGLVCVDGFVTENPFQAPGAPGKPELNDWDVDHFEMKWAEPRNNGGSRILGYELEARLWKDPIWFKAGEVRMQIERGLVEGVELGQSYAVRVRARNAAGFGHWSIESDQLVCRHRALKPRVKFEISGRELVLKEGDTLTVFAEIAAEPAAEDIQWFISDRVLGNEPGTGILIDNSKPHRSKLQKDSVSRKDCGILICEATNMHGKHKASVQLTVHSRPSCPEDRLVVSNIDSSGCHLSWQAARDDGGLPVEYLVEKFIVASDTWMRQGQTSSTELTVNDLEAGKEYGFRVFAVNEIGESEPLTASKTIIAKNPFTVSLPPSAPEVIEWNERSMTIKWKAPIDDGGAPITAYHIEARTVGGSGGEWQAWEMVEGATTRVTLQKLQRGQEYQFRVTAVNKAGKSEPGHPSRPKLAKETDLLPYIELKGLRDVTVSVNERVKFDLPIYGEPPPTVVWSRGDEPIDQLGDKSIQVTTTDTHTKIVFTSVRKCHEGVYSVIIANRSGQDAAKVAIKVLDRPAAPESPMKTSVEGSVCNLLWKKVKEDGGAPIEHYQIEKVDEERGGWAACGHTKENTYAVRGLLPGRSYRFRVCAVNRIGDSDFLTSEPVSVTDGEDSLVRSL